MTENAPDAQPDATPNPAPDEAAPDAAPSATPEKDPSDWATGGEPMTGPQASYLRTLCQEAGRDFDESMNKADASKLIDELQQQTGRGR